MLTCVECGREFEPYPIVNGHKLNLQGRQRCLGCLPLRRLSRPRKRVARAPRTKVCAACGATFPAKAVIDGRPRSLYSRSFCLDCSPFGAHNTGKEPPGTANLAELRRRRRNAKTYRSQKRRRLARKAMLVEARGGRCVDCGRQVHIAVFEFHHRDPLTKAFTLAEFNGSLQRLLDEAAKCDLLCANCHRLRHAKILRPATDPVAAHRRRRKEQIVHLMGDCCEECGASGHASLFEFHHLNAAGKEFGLSESGIPRSWTKIFAELAKCVMLCANCHREVHAGIRDLDEAAFDPADDVRTLAEAALAYVA